MIATIREPLDNSEQRIRPELLAQAVNRQASPDAVFTTDTGMTTVWLSRFVQMTDRRALLGSFNLGSMANAMPQALGAQALDCARQVIAFCGDGGISILLDVVTDPDEISVPGKVKLHQAWGFAISKIRETVLSEGDGRPGPGPAISRISSRAAAARTRSWG